MSYGGQGSELRTSCFLTRSARSVSVSANVPRFALGANLLLYFAAPDTERALLDAVSFIARRLHLVESYA